MNQSTSKRPASRIAGIALAAALTLAPATTALAKITAVTGVDYLYTKTDGYEAPVTETKGFVDVLAVTSDKASEDFIYLQLIGQDDRIMADHLAFKLSDAATADENAELATLAGDDSTNNQYAAMVSVNIDQLDPTATYTLRAYSDREEKEDPIYEGQINVIYGIFGEGTQPEPIAVRTMGTKDATGRGCPAPKQITRKNGSGMDLFELTSPTPDTNGNYIYIYKLSDDAPESVEGKINYYVLGETDPLTVDGNDPVTIEKDTSTVVSIPSIVKSGEAYYRTLTVGNDVKLSYPGMSEASVFVKELTGNWAAGAPYTAHIHYVDEEDGNYITPSGMVDQLAVTKPYKYTAPNRVYVIQEGSVVEYELSENGTLTFDLGAAADKQTANVKYRKVNTFTEKTWVINYIDGSEGGNGNVIKNVTVTATELGGSTYKTLASSELGGLVPTQAEIDLASYSGSVVNVYCVPAGQERSTDPYNITVNFVNIADNSVISSQQATVNLVGPNSLSAYDLDLAVPREFNQNGVQWVILPGQLSGGPETYHLYHGYYSPERTYTVFFRDVNDDLHEATVITRVVTVYDDVVVTDLGTATTGTTGTTTGTTTTDTTTAAAGTAAADNGTANATLTNNGGVQTVGNQNGQGTTIVRDDGTDTGTERITEDQTPLASPDGTGAANPTDAAQTTNVSTGATFGLIGGIAGIGALLAVLFARKANVEEKAQNKDQDQS